MAVSPIAVSENWLEALEVNSRFKSSLNVCQVLGNVLFVFKFVFKNFYTIFNKSFIFSLHYRYCTLLLKKVWGRKYFFLSF